MSFEFWAGVGVATLFFVLSSAISLLAPDLRARLGDWFGSRRLIGATKRMQAIERRIGKLRRLANNPVSMAAHFWTDMFLLILLLTQLIFLIWLGSNYSGLLGVVYLLGATALWVVIVREASVSLRLAAQMKDPDASVADLEKELHKLEHKYGK